MFFAESQNVTDKELFAKLVQRGVEYTVKRIEAVHRSGCFDQRLNEQGQSRAGWINKLAADRMSDWKKWAALLTEPIA
jgi:hypothetical protein